MEPFDRVSSTDIYKGWARVSVDRLRSRDTGKEGEYVSVHVDPGVGVLAFTEKDEVVLVEQYRNAVGRLQLELPGGGIKPTETVDQGANRELQEETGYTAQQLDYLGFLNPSGGVLNLPLHLVIARNLTPGPQKLDELEELIVHHIPYEQLKQELRENKHFDMSLYAAVGLYELRKRQ